MYMIGIPFVAMIFVFSIMTLFLTSLEKDKMEIEKRVQGLVTVETEPEPEKESRRLRRKKEKEKDKEKNKIQLSDDMKKRVQGIEEELYNLGFKISTKNFFIMWFGAAVLIPLVFTMLGFNQIIALAGLAVAVVFPIFYLRRKKKKRREALEEQLVDAIGVLINALRAGYTFQSAISTIADDMDDPIAEEFGRVFRETQRGITLEESLDALSERIGSDDLSIMCTAINIQRQVGGNLSEILENISGTIRQRISLKGEIKSKTSSGRISGYIVGALPVFILLGVSLINPMYSDTLLHTGTGHILLIASACLEGIGFAVIQKIVTVKY